MNEITFNEKSHRYKVNGKHKPSVTTILNMIHKEKLEIWKRKQGIIYIGNHLKELAAEDMTEEKAGDILKAAKEEHKRISDEAAGIGTLVHEAIQAFFSGRQFDLEKLDKQAATAFNAFLNYANEHNFKCEATEVKVYHPEVGYCGTVDAVGTMDCEKVLMDWKTGSGIYPEASLQVAAYVMACEETVEEIKKAYIVRFDKQTGEFEVKVLERAALELAFQCFISAMNIYTYMKGARK
jgi:hypothetical protein